MAEPIQVKPAPAVAYKESGTSDILGDALKGANAIPQPDAPHQLTLWVDIEYCAGCRSCTTSCKAENNTNVGEDFNRVIYVESGKYPDTKRYFVPMPCMHCGKAPCLAACPVGAISKNGKNGIVEIDSDKCIGCRYCIWACPFGAPQFNSEKNVSYKCTLCAHRTTDANGDLTGLRPACVDGCPGRVRFFGDQNSLSLARRNTRAKRVGLGVTGANPSVLY